MGGRGVAFLCTLVVALATCPAVQASQLVDRDASGVRLKVKGDTALLTYQAHGAVRHVFVSGASDALVPDSARPQVRFTLDYTGGRARGKRPLWRTFHGSCAPYDGPTLAWLIRACKAPDGSYWAVQSWQRLLPHRGFPAWKPSQQAWELRISHWSGALARLEVYRDWAFGTADDLFGRLTYDGVPVHGFRSSAAGAELDGYGRSLYIDTFDSPYGTGWRRETSILFRKPSGVFCYSFWPTRDVSLPGYPNDLRPAGRGSRYRITAIGPGVTPDVIWEGAALHPFNPASAADRTYESSMNGLLDRLAGSDAFCKTQH
jgi:hypothetical protein